MPIFLLSVPDLRSAGVPGVQFFIVLLPPLLIDIYASLSRSLQLKVKELKENRERAISEENPVDGKGKENGDVGRSCNGSNSSCRKPNQDSDSGTQNGNNNGKTGGCRQRDAPAAGEESYDGSSDTIARCTEAAMPAAKNSGESMAESKEEETSKEGSDVQSSASPSRRRFRRRSATVSGASSDGDDVEADEVSPSLKKDNDQSQPWSRFLDIFRSSKLGSTFEERLESQVPSNSCIFPASILRSRLLIHPSRKSK